jgi:hypothetical protein
VQVRPVITTVQAALLNQAALAGDDPAVELAAQQLVDALTPVLQAAAFELAEQAAGEVRAQIPEHAVDVVLEGGDPVLRVGDARPAGEHRQPSEDLDARITLRLTPTLKQLIEDAAQSAGDSVNSWVVDTLGKRARSRGSGKQYTDSFDL